MTVTVRREIPIKLSPEEIRKTAEELVQKQIALEELVAQAREDASAARGEAKDLRAEISKLAHILKKGEAVRALECREILDPEARTVDIVRADTGELVMTRPASPAELQLGIPFEAPAGEAFAPGNLVQVESVPAAGASIYQIQAIERDQGRDLAVLDLVSAVNSEAPERLDSIELAYLKPATYSPPEEEGPEEPGPAPAEAEPPARPKRPSRSRSAGKGRPAPRRNGAKKAPTARRSPRDPSGARRKRS